MRIRSGDENITCVGKSLIWMGIGRGNILKIAYVITRSDVMGGASVHLLDLAEGMVRCGHEVVICVGGNGVLQDHAKKKGLKCVSLRFLVREIHPLKDVACVFELRSFLANYKPDIVHLHSSKAGIVGRVASGMLAIPVIFTAHGWAFTEGVSAIKRRFYLLVERLMAGLADKIIAVSDYDRNLALASAVGSSELIETIHNGVPDIAGCARGEKSSSAVRFIMVARFDVPKDQMLLVEAFSRIERKDWILEFVGDGPLIDSVRARVHDLGMADRVEFSGGCYDVPARLKRSDVFCLVSNWEGFPLTIIEAMRAALPVIASSVGGVSEAVVDGETGFLVKKGDVSGLAEAINELLVSEEKRVGLGGRGRRLYEENFNFERMLEKTETLYQKVKRNC